MSTRTINKGIKCFTLIQLNIGLRTHIKVSIILGDICLKKNG